MKKIVFIISVVFALAYLYFVYNPIIIENKEENSQSSESGIITEKNGVIKPFDHLIIDKRDEIKAILIIRDRENISNEIPFGHIFKSSNKEAINKLKLLNFKYTGADIATVENEIIIYENDKIVFRSGIVLDSNKEGLQNSEFGWIITENGNLSKIFKNFNRNFSPIIEI